MAPFPGSVSQLPGNRESAWGRFYKEKYVTFLTGKDSVSGIKTYSVVNRIAKSCEVDILFLFGDYV